MLPPRSSVPLSDLTLILRPPSFSLRDRVNSLSLIFSASLHVLQQIPTDSCSFSDPQVAETWRLYPLLRHPSLTLHISFLLDSSPLPRTSDLLESWARIISDAPLFRELGFNTSLTILSSKDIRILLSRPSAGEAAIAQVMEQAGKVIKVEMHFDFQREGGSRVTESAFPKIQEFISLTDTAIRSFWEDKVAKYGRLLGTRGLFEACDERILPVEVIADVLTRRTGGECKDVEAKLWEVVITNVKRAGPLSVINSKETQAEWNTNDGSVSEEDNKHRMNEEDGGLYGHMNIDMEDWDDGLLTGNDEDEMLWGSGWDGESTYGHSALFEEVHDEVMVGEDMDLLENIEICLNHKSEEVKAMLEDMK